MSRFHPAIPKEICSGHPSLPGTRVLERKNSLHNEQWDLSVSVLKQVKETSFDLRTMDTNESGKKTSKLHIFPLCGLVHA